MKNAARIFTQPRPKADLSFQCVLLKKAILQTQEYDDCNCKAQPQKHTNGPQRPYSGCFAFIHKLSVRVTQLILKINLCPKRRIFFGLRIGVDASDFFLKLFSALSRIGQRTEEWEFH